MLSYGPMENIKKGLNPSANHRGSSDPRVAYWEAAKYAARLRAARNKVRGFAQDGPAAGHFSASDRYQLYKERAYEHAFVLDSLGLSNAKRVAK